MWSANYCCTQTEVARYCNVNSKKKSKLWVNIRCVTETVSVNFTFTFLGMATYFGLIPGESWRNFWRNRVDTEVNFLVIIFLSFCYRALYVNLIGVASIISCACLAGIALYAFYSECDPIQRGVISQPDQVSVCLEVYIITPFYINHRSLPAYAILRNGNFTPISGRSWSIRLLRVQCSVEHTVIRF